MFNKSYKVRKKKLLLFNCIISLLKLDVQVQGLSNDVIIRKSIPRPCSVSFADRLLYTEYMYIYLLCIYLQYIYFSLPYCCIHLNYRDINTIQLKSAAFHARNKALKVGKQKLISPHLKRIFRRSKLFFDDFFSFFVTILQ